MQGRGGRGGRINSSPRYISHGKLLWTCERYLLLLHFISVYIINITTFCVFTCVKYGVILTPYQPVQLQMFFLQNYQYFVLTNSWKKQILPRFCSFFPSLIDEFSLVILVTYYSYLWSDAGGGRNPGPGKENGVNQAIEKGGSLSIPTSQEMKNKEKIPVTRWLWFHFGFSVVIGWLSFSYNFACSLEDGILNKLMINCLLQLCICWKWFHESSFWKCFWSNFIFGRH